MSEIVHQVRLQHVDSRVFFKSWIEQFHHNFLSFDAFLCLTHVINSNMEHSFLKLSTPFLHDRRAINYVMLDPQFFHTHPLSLMLYYTNSDTFSFSKMSLEAFKIVESAWPAVRNGINEWFNWEIRHWVVIFSSSSNLSKNAWYYVKMLWSNALLSTLPCIDSGGIHAPS